MPTLCPKPRRAPASATLDTDRRSGGFARARAGVDVLVIGGGITGAGAALDAAARGLRVCLVEQRDLAAGTSSRSSKLIHGGLRYLEQRDFTLVREALRERALQLRLSPHLVRPVPFLFPLRGRVWERAYVGAGIALYDALGGAGALPGHRHLTRTQALRLAPALRDDTLIGAIRYWDGQVDDARHTLAVARTAARHGADVLTSARVTGLRRADGRVVGADVEDLETGEHHPIPAATVINATGVWSDRLTPPGTGMEVRASKGIHLVVPGGRIDAGTGIILRTDRSVLFVIPWPGIHDRRCWLIGTTDTHYDADTDHPVADHGDVQYLLDQVNTVLRRPLDRSDITGVYAGLRPLLHGRGDDTVQLSREHAIATPEPGLITVAGGKYTTYRVMAADAVDTAATQLPATVPPSVTDRLPLVGADGFVGAWNSRRQLAADVGLSARQVEHLLRRYGTTVTEVLDNAEPGELQPIPGAETHLLTEARYAASHEGALHLDDVMNRRTRIAIETPDGGRTAARPIAEAIGATLGWTSDEIEREVAGYHASLDALTRATTATIDAADAARQLRVHDVRG